MGSPGLAAWIAQIAFWTLLALGVWTEEVTPRGAALFVGVWLAGVLGLPRISWWTGPFVTSYVAVVDIVLVFIVFKGDVRLT
jgi:hypothetical protein